MSQIRKLGKHTLIYATGIVIGKAASFIMLPIYTRFLTPADYGVLELLQMTIDVVGMLAGLGLASSVFKFYAEEDAPESRAEVISTSTTALAILSVVSAAIGAAFAPQLTRLVLGPGQPTIYFQLFFLIYFIQTITTIPYLFIRAEHRSVMFVVLNVVRLILSLSFNILFVVYFRLGIRGVLYSTIIAWSLTGGYLTLYTYRRVGRRFSLPRIEAMTLFALPLVLWSLANFVLTFSDRYFLKYFTDNATVGIYSLAYQFGFALAAFALVPFNSIWDPQRFEVARQPDADQIFRRVFFYMNLVLLTCACVICVSVHDILRVMAGYSFRSAYKLVPVLMVPFILQAWSNYCNIGLYLKNRTRPLAWAAVITVIVDLGLNYLLIPRYGPYGAAWATAGAYAVRLALVYPLSQRYVHINYGWGRVLAVTALLTAVYFARNLLPSFRMFPSLAISAGFLAAAGLVIHYGILHADERALVKEFAMKPLALLNLAA